METIPITISSLGMALVLVSLINYQSSLNAMAVSTTILAFSISSLFFLPTLTSLANNQTDFLSLLAFKSALTDPLNSLTSWNHTTHFCRWNGIRCSRRHRHRVVEISLPSQGLVGPLSPHLGNLSLLRNIILQNNTLHGRIPQELTFLRRLEILELSNNSFNGPIPRNLSRCPNIFYLNLIDNELSGNIPSELGSLSKLEDLGLSINRFLGPIPSSIGNLTSLEQLSLANCGLEGEIPASIAQLRNLKYFFLHENNLTGTIPHGLYNLSRILKFSVEGNLLEGSIPSTIGLTLPNLMGLSLGTNRFSGKIPPSISNASLLDSFEFFENYFTGPVPSFGRLNNLEKLLFASNLIADDAGFISSLSNLTSLRYIDFGGNKLSGRLPESLGNLSNQLTWLSLYENRIHGGIPVGIGNLISLTSIDLAFNSLEGPIPFSVAKLSNLHELYLDGNMLGSEVPSSLGNLTLLNSLSFSENNFSGNLPSSLGNCTSLLELDFSDNSFNGAVPPEIMSLSSLAIVLNLSYNGFEGSIPYEVGSLSNLQVLDLSNNMFSALIPNTMAKCMTLQQLYLEGNLLEGELPLVLNALTGLQVLDLSRNNFSGPIPLFLSKLNLERLNLSFNRLQGEVPTAGIFRNGTSISLDGNEDLCGGISELKLSPCTSPKSHKKRLSTLLKILIPTAAGAGGILLLIAFFAYKRSVSKKNVDPASSFTGVEIMRLGYGDLFRATDGFSETNLLGLGRFGSVYKGVLEHDQSVVAVKVLNLFVRGASKSFLAECNAIRNVRHRNLLKILSVCESIDFRGNEFKALVYEFKPNGSLEKWLHHSNEEGGEANNLNLMQRLNIAVDVAEAISYLHSGTDVSIVHGDLKPSNILLDEDMTACVGDFGLAKIVSDIAPSQESNSTSTGIRGTIGYVPPEYGTSRLVSIQGDVYSYGVVLLELFTNIRPTDDVLEDRVNLHRFVGEFLPERAMEVVDPLLQSGMDSEKVKRCIASIMRIGVSCSKEMARERMSMVDVVNELHKIQKLLSA